MNFRAVFFPMALALATQAVRADDAQPAQSPGFVTRVIEAFQGSKSGGDRKGVVRTKNLLLAMDLSPLPLKLSEVRMLKVVISLTDMSGKAVHLEFPTTQRFEILVRDKSGRQLVQWSEDELFTTEPTFVTINPREHLEYEASVATRDLVAGQQYVVEGFFLNYKDLKIRKTIVPEK